MTERKKTTLVKLMIPLIKLVKCASKEMLRRKLVSQSTLKILDSES